MTRQNGNPRKTRPKPRTRRERPRPLTHRASRALRGRSRLVAQANCAKGLGRVSEIRNLQINKGEAIHGHRQETTGNRQPHNASSNNPSANCSTNTASFVDCTPDYVANFALRKTLARDPEFKKWKAISNGAGNAGKPRVQSKAAKPHDSAASPFEESHRLPARGGDRNGCCI